MKKDKKELAKLKESTYFHKGHLSLMGKRAVSGYLFILPFLIGLIGIFIPSIIDAFIYSTHEITNTPTGYELTYVGMDIFANIRKEGWFLWELQRTVTKMLYNIPLIIFFSFFMALLLNQKFKGRTAARAILFLPVIIASGCIIQVENSNALAGLMEAGDTVDAINSMDITTFLIGIGLSPSICETISTVMTNIYAIISQSGVQILIFLSALQTISPSLYEASSIEGATGWENFWKITFPMLSPYILTNAVYTIIDAATSHTSTFMNVIDSVNNQSIYGMETAIAFSLIFFAVIAAILGLFVLLISRLVFYYD
ncbi:MAG: sugar ABC transporter permease [Oscillospiraceae bacterium]|nr:sugar ABC transporter permease [Oscillospiraceae bacterium]